MYRLNNHIVTRVFEGPVLKEEEYAIVIEKSAYDKAVDALKALLTLSHHSIGEERWRIEQTLKELGEL